MFLHKYLVQFNGLGTLGWTPVLGTQADCVIHVSYRLQRWGTTNHQERLGGRVGKASAVLGLYGRDSPVPLYPSGAFDSDVVNVCKG